MEENQKTPVIANPLAPSPTSSHHIARQQQASAQPQSPPLSPSINRHEPMGRRARSGSNSNNTQIVRNNAGNANLNQPQPADNEFPIPTTGGMSPGSRYNHNLKVLRRRDPSIVSIFDQFSHVCLYHYNGEKWEKKGYEGSMFLYERDAYPPYGFYMLNRMGMDDYIQRMYPEDDMNVLGEYLMYKCYPDYTALRLGLPLDRETDPELVADKHKGKTITVGLWMFATDSREPMKDVMMRLHYYIKRAEPYPERFRYGPDHPPPPNPYLGISNDSSPEQTPEVTRAKVSAAHASKQDSRPQSTSATTSMSEIDKLFSKLGPEQSPSPAPVPVKNGQQGITLDCLFAAALSGQNPTKSAPAPANKLQPQPPSNPNTTSRSLALLDSIFASATPHDPNGSDDTGPVQISAPALQILSPQPTPSTVPQVLNQNVISTLLGLAPSPGGSVSSSSTNITAHRYEGDNESNSEGGSEEIEYPTSNLNSILTEATRNAITSKGKQSPMPSFSFPSSSDDVQTTPRIQGDVTPRPALKGMPTFSPSQQPKDRSLKQGATRKSQNGVTPPDVSQVPPTAADKPKPATGASRKLVPFEPDSELWPYPRQPLDDRATEEEDVVELDFKETSALSDINAFLSKPKANASTANGAGANGKKKRKEKNKEEREQIEKSWDDPVKMGYAVGPNIPNEPPAKPIHPQPTAASSAKRKNKLAAQPQTNGEVTGQPTASSSKDKDRAGDGLDRDVVAESLISTIANSSLPKQKDVKQMDRNTFVREVLTLIHTDKSFIDNLYADYLARS